MQRHTTILLRPIMTAFFPSMLAPVLFISSSEPSGVHGTVQLLMSPRESRPALNTVRPSTSLSTLMASVHHSASMSEEKESFKCITI